MHIHQPQEMERLSSAMEHQRQEQQLQQVQCRRDKVQELFAAKDTTKEMP
jgi:hypothetical protein